MKNKFLYCILSLFILFSCSPKHQVEYKEYTSMYSMLKKELEVGYKAEESIYSILVFTNGYEGENVLVLNQKDTIFQGAIYSDGSMGLARGFRVDNTKPIKIIINNSTIKLKKQDAVNHKFIYLGKVLGEKYNYRVIYSKVFERGEVRGECLVLVGVA